MPGNAEPGAINTMSHIDTLPSGGASREQIAVWDPFVRVFHWSLVTAFAVAYVVGDHALAIHVWAGYAVGGLIVFRIVWGFVGPRHARFADFMFGPSVILGYLRDLVAFRAKRYLGHSPAGSAMVLALLLGLTALTATGLVTYAVRNNAGPLAGLVTATATATPPTTVAPPPQELRAATGRTRTPRPGRAWRQAHELIANVLLVLIGLHVLGVIVSSLAHRENLVRAMITGRKPAETH
jgi:cytochrome b